MMHEIIASEDRDDSDIQMSLNIMDTFREESAKRTRELLGIPNPKAKVPDLDVEFVLAYLGFCADDQAMVDQDGAEQEYDHSRALDDLTLLDQAASKVEAMIKAARKNAKGGAKRLLKAAVCALPAGSNLWEGEDDFAREYQEAMENWVRTTEMNNGKKAVGMVIGRRKGVTK